jgi:hypothetical protein
MDQEVIALHRELLYPVGCKFVSYKAFLYRVCTLLLKFLFCLMLEGESVAFSGVGRRIPYRAASNGQFKTTGQNYDDVLISVLDVFVGIVEPRFIENHIRQHDGDDFTLGSSLVRMKALEPSCPCGAQEPEPCASASSATTGVSVTCLLFSQPIPPPWPLSARATH